MYYHPLEQARSHHSVCHYFEATLTTTVNDRPETVNVPASTETNGNTAVFLFYILLLSCEFLPYRQLYSFIAHTIKL